MLVGEWPNDFSCFFVSLSSAESHGGSTYCGEGAQKSSAGDQSQGSQEGQVADDEERDAYCMLILLLPSHVCLSHTHEMVLLCYQEWFLRGGVVAGTFSRGVCVCGVCWTSGANTLIMVESIQVRCPELTGELHRRLCRKLDAGMFGPRQDVMDGDKAAADIDAPFSADKAGSVE